MLFDILLIIIVIILIATIIITWKYDYWKKRNVPYVKPVFPFGCINKTIFGRATLQQQIDEYYEQFSGYKYFGIHIFRHPFLFISDPEIVKCILIKNFANFKNNIFKTSEHADALASQNPFILKDDRWKIVRNQLSPAFTPAKIKNMFPNMVKISKQLVQHLKDNLNSRNGILAKDLALCFTTENVALCGLNINAQSFENDPNNLKNVAGNLFEQNENLATLLALMLLYMDPELAVLLRVKVFSKRMTDFITNLVYDVLKHRRSNNIQANDYLDHLKQVQEKCKEYDFNDFHIACHFMTLFIDGVDTSALALSILLYEIARQPEIFKKLRREIDTKLTSELTYQSLLEMPYLDSCINETLRKNTPFIFMAKECTEPFTLPSPYKGYPELKIEKGTYIFIPTYLIHHNKKWHPNPNSYMPERFYDEEKNEKIPVDMFFPFGDGPRICLGRNFATAQLKAATIALVKNFDIVVNNKTEDILQPVSPTFFNFPTGPIYLDFYERGEIYTE